MRPGDRKRRYRESKGGSAIILTIIALFILFGVDGNGKWLVLFPGLMALVDWRDFFMGMPIIPGRSKQEFGIREDIHVPDCPFCRGWGRLPRAMLLIRMWYRDQFYECPHCFGCGKIRHADMEWYYKKRE